MDALSRYRSALIAGLLVMVLVVAWVPAGLATSILRGEAAAIAVPQGAASAGELVVAATLPDLSIASLQNARLPGSIDNDRGLLIGGVGSDLWRSPTDPPNEFWMVTDRGPNDEVKVAGEQRRTFPLPAYTPAILHVRLDGETVTVLETLPIVGRSGQPVTGLPNVEGHEAPYDYAGTSRLAFNPSGLDVEGLVRAPSGEFWAVEEYGPSLVQIDASGMVLRRFVPDGLPLDGADYPVSATLPAIVGARTPNRGFEGLTLSLDEKTLYLAIQAPLSNPDEQTADGSRTIRLLAFDLASERVTAEYAYRLGPTDAEAAVAQAVPSSKPKRAEKPDRAAKPGRAAKTENAAKPESSAMKGPKPESMKVSALAPVSPTSLLVLERTSKVARLYLADFGGATNILGSGWDAPSTVPSLEALPDPASAGVAALTKSLAADLTTLPGLPQKIEGIAIVDAQTVAVANDNDFDIGNFDPSGNNVGRGFQSKILLVALPRPLP